MALGAFQGIAAAVTGDAIENATIEVREGGGGDLVSIFSDRDGNTPLPNPWADATDVGGYFRIFVEPGVYDITASDGAGNIRTFEWVAIQANIIMGEPVPSVDRVFELLSYPTAGLSNGDSIVVTRYHTTGPARGGGTFRWASGGNKATADGGLRIDPDTTGGWDGSGADLATFLNAQGTGVGTGLWIRVGTANPDAYMWGAHGVDDAIDLAATNKAFASLGRNRGLWMLDGQFGRGSPALYSAGAYPGALAGHIAVGTEAAPSDDSQPVLRITKWSNANRSVDSTLWEQGPVYFETLSTTGDAFTVGGTAIANARGDSAGDHVGWHARGIARSANANVFGLWAFVENAFGPVAKEIMAIEANVRTQFDAGWANSAVSGGGCRGMVVLTVDGSEAATVGVTIGKQSTANGGWWTNLLLRTNGTQPNTAGVDDTIIGNGEQIRFQGASVVGNRYAGMRFQSGHFNYALSTVEAASFANDAAIILKRGHRIAWGDAPVPGAGGGHISASTTAQSLLIAGFSLDFLSAERAITWQGGTRGRIQSLATVQPGSIYFEDTAGGSVAIRTPSGGVGLRVKGNDPTNAVVIRVGGVGKTVQQHPTADSAHPGFRYLMVSN